MIDEKEAKIKIHEYWMAFRRNYHKVKEGHRPKLTHEEVEDLLFHIISCFDKVEEIILKPSTSPSATLPKKKAEVVILDNNPLSIVSYIEDHPDSELAKETNSSFIQDCYNEFCPHHNPDDKCYQEDLKFCNSKIRSPN